MRNMKKRSLALLGGLLLTGALTFCEIKQDCMHDAYAASVEEQSSEDDAAQTKIILRKTAAVYVGHAMTLNATVRPQGKVTWKSSDETIGTVDKNGRVVGKSKGTVTVTASCNGTSASCLVTVKQSKVALGGSFKILQGSLVKLNAVTKPAEARVRYRSLNQSVLKVDEEGAVTGVGKGTGKIEARVPGAKTTATVKVLPCDYQMSATQKTVMRGKYTEIYVKNAEDTYVYFDVLEGYDCVDISSSGNHCTIRGKHAGTAVIGISTWDYDSSGQRHNWYQECTVEILGYGITDQDFALAKDAEKLLQLKCKDAGKVKSVTWKSSSASVAAIQKKQDFTARLTGKQVGKATITAEVLYRDGTRQQYTTKVRISNPRVKQSVISMVIYQYRREELRGLVSNSRIKWKSRQPSIASVQEDGSIYAKKKGTAILKAIVDGTTVSMKVRVCNPVLKETGIAVAPGGTKKIQVTGIFSDTKVTYQSSNKYVATVDTKGNVRGKRFGKTEITVDISGNKLYALVEVAPQKAIDACAQGKYIQETSVYSQEHRMEDGYFDCSALVFKAYGRDAALLGGAEQWAPTAASMAEYMEQTGKVIAYDPVDFDKIRPGDLLFAGGDDNGRYLGIYHVSMYYGGGLMLEEEWYRYPGFGKIVMVARPVQS